MGLLAAIYSSRTKIKELFKFNTDGTLPNKQREKCMKTHEEKYTKGRL